LLDHLHTLPMGVRIVDDIEYGDESKTPPTSDR
jgi:hypothetical protein